jgi:UDP-GlcNAc:undecaprenyl-phosphate/decaprenyl-phosphate GlcNAc-1-phosphate transferase
MIPAMPLIALSYIFMTALFASLLMVPFLHRWALDRRVVDIPDERKVHRNAVPRLGGIAICMAFLFSLLVFVDLTRGMRGILAGVLIIFVTGLVDDLHGISPMRKFFGELCAVLTTMVVGHLYIHTLGDLFGMGEIVLPFWLAIPVTLVAIVGVVNAFNLIDGLDGLAGGVSVITLAAFGVLTFHSANKEVLILCVALLGAMLGFLKYNFFPARIFMGDAGSLVVGFVISFLAICLTQGGAGQVQPVVPLLVIGLPVADAVWVMTSRICARQSPFVADRTHVHHKFLALGFEHRYTVILIYSISLFWAATAVFFQDKPAVLLLGGYLVLSLLTYLAIRFLSTRRHLLRFLGKDSTVGIRESATYHLLADRVAGTMPLLQCFIFAYLALAAVAGSAVESSLLKLLLVFLVACSALLLFTRDSGNQFLLSMYYGAALVITFVVTRFGGMEFPPGHALRQWGELLLIGMALMTALRFIFRRPGEFYLTSLDYLLLGLTLFLAVVAPQITGVINLTGVLVRGIILFIAIKMVAEQGKRPARLMAYSILGALLVMTVRGYLG